MCEMAGKRTEFQSTQILKKQLPQNANMDYEYHWFFGQWKLLYKHKIRQNNKINSPKKLLNTNYQV